MLKIFFILIGLSIIPINAAEPVESHFFEPIELCNSGKLLFFETESESPHPLQWHDGRNQKMIGTLSCVTKKLYNAISGAHTLINNLVKEKSNNTVTLDSQSILCNQDGFWCALGEIKKYISKNDTYKSVEAVFFGHKTEFLHYKIKPDTYNIRSTYHKSTFCITGKNNYYAVMPDCDEVWEIHCNNMWNNEHKFFNIGHLEKTFNRIIEIPTWLEQNNVDIEQVFSQRNNSNTPPPPITIKKYYGQKPVFVHYSIDMQSTLFLSHWWNDLKTLYGSWNANPSCTCATNFINYDCEQQCNALCAAADREQAYDLIPQIQKDFAQHHILHEIHTSLHPRYTIYSNYLGDIVALDQNSNPLKIINITDNCAETKVTKNDLNDFTFFSLQAQNQAQRWQEKNGLLYKEYIGEYSLTKHIYLFNLLQLQNCNISDHQILDTYVPISSEIGDVHVQPGTKYNPIFLSIKDTVNNTYALIRLYGNRSRKYEYQYDTLNEMIAEQEVRSDNHIYMHADKTIIDSMIHYLRFEYDNVSLKNSHLKIAQQELFALPHIINGFIGFFDNLHGKNINPKEIMEDPHYVAIQSKRVDILPSTLQERLYTAASAFGNYKLHYNMPAHNVLIIIAAYLATQLQLFYCIPYSDQSWSGILSQYAAIGGTFFSRSCATNCTQHTV